MSSKPNSTEPENSGHELTGIEFIMNGPTKIDLSTPAGRLIQNLKDDEISSQLLSETSARIIHQTLLNLQENDTIDLDLIEINSRTVDIVATVRRAGAVVLVPHVICEMSAPEAPEKVPKPPFTPRDRPKPRYTPPPSGIRKPRVH